MADCDINRSADIRGEIGSIEHPIVNGRAFIHNIRIREVRCTFADKNLEMFRTCFVLVLSACGNLKGDACVVRTNRCCGGNKVFIGVAGHCKTFVIGCARHICLAVIGNGSAVKEMLEVTCPCKSQTVAIGIDGRPTAEQGVFVFKACAPLYLTDSSIGNENIGNVNGVRSAVSAAVLLIGENQPVVAGFGNAPCSVRPVNIAGHGELMLVFGAVIKVDCAEIKVVKILFAARCIFKSYACARFKVTLGIKGCNAVVLIFNVALCAFPLVVNGGNPFAAFGDILMIAALRIQNRIE